MRSPESRWPGRTNRLIRETVAARAAALREFLLPPLPNSCFRGKSKKDICRGRAQRSGPGSSNKRIRSWLRTIYPYSLDAKRKRSGAVANSSKTIAQYLVEITEENRLDAQAQYASKKLDFHRNSGKDNSTLSKHAFQEFEKKWSNIHTRMCIVPGKVVLRALRDAVQKDLGVNLTDIQIIDEYRDDEIPSDMKALIERLDEFRKGEALVSPHA